MNVLALDTATPETVAALLRADGEVFAATETAERRHAARLLPLAEEVLAAAGLPWGALARLGVGVGPGGFTGLRIGIATARGLAQALGLEVVPVSSLDALCGDGEVAAIDARRGEVFARGPGLPVGAWAPEEVARRVAPGTVIRGDGALRYRELFAAAGLVVPDGGHGLDGARLCRLAASGVPVPVHALVPDYRREPDAKPRP